ncbi:MAG: bacillithiol system redox-active protein YtxJ [Lentisphaeria bacterium]|nr:bacillithiol system redox-active protein YtxJ [Lentisphaeria bacterium]NQZ70705.1 bacillithiol system redox-active protein YtxJ [Lentisphaeria bacterium]
MAIKHIETIDDLDSVIEESNNRPVMLFKHSTRCPISTFAQNEYIKFVDSNDDDTVLYTHLDLIQFRPVSSAIAEKTGVVHQSPQAILLVNAKAVWSETHSQINEDSLSKAIAEI